MNQWPLADVVFDDYADIIEGILEEIKSAYIPDWIDKNGSYEELFFIETLSYSEKLALAVSVFVENKQWCIVRSELVVVPYDTFLAWTNTVAELY